MVRLIIYTICICSLGATVVGQNEPDNYQQDIENAIERISETEGDESDAENLVDELLSIKENPLNINSVTSEQLKSLNLLNEYQIAALIDYRKAKGQIMSLYELLYLPGFRQEDIDLIKPFIICEQSDSRKPPFKELLNQPKQQLTLRYQRILEEQAGYKTSFDSLLGRDTETARYLGSPDKIYLRYRIEFREYLKAGIITEKDAGEDFFCGSNKLGFDYYSAFVAYLNKTSLLRTIVLGDYQVQLGQGLLVWSSYSLGKTSSIDRLLKSSEIFKGNTSVNENRFFRGAALTFGRDELTISCFGSGNYIDASLADSAMGEKYFTGFTETGYHATLPDLRKENTVRQMIIGSSIKLSLRNLKLGFNGLFMQFDKTCAVNNTLYKSYSFSGNAIKGISLDYRIFSGRAQFFGESAYSNNHLAVLNGLIIYVNSEINIGMLHRHYDKEYFSYYSGAFSENSTLGNENGFFIGTEFHYSKTWCRIYADLFSFPWLKYRVNTISQGYDIFFEAGRKINLSEIAFRFNHCEKPQNDFEEDHIQVVTPLIKDKYRIYSKAPVGTHLSIQNRLEVVSTRQEGNKRNVSYYFAQDLSYKEQKIPIEFIIRGAYFHAEDYNSRIYAYERDISSAGTSQMLYGEGWRLMVLVRWNATKKISIWFKLAQSIYPDQEKIGSGLNAIDKNHRTELKVQLAVKI